MSERVLRRGRPIAPARGKGLFSLNSLFAGATDRRAAAQAPLRALPSVPLTYVSSSRLAQLHRSFTRSFTAASPQLHRSGHLVDPAPTGLAALQARPAALRPPPSLTHSQVCGHPPIRENRLLTCTLEVLDVSLDVLPTTGLGHRARGPGYVSPPGAPPFPAAPSFSTCAAASQAPRGLRRAPTGSRRLATVL